MQAQTRPDRPWLVTSGAQDPDTVDRLLRLLPEWFGIESANAHYVAPLEEIPDFWPGNPCLIMVKVLQPLARSADT